MKETAVPAKTAALSLIGLSRHFGPFKALDQISLDIRDGEFFTIVGPSGSGKTTMLRILAGLDQPTEGSLLLRGADITRTPPNKRPTAMVFQSLALFDHRSVGENVEFALKMRGMPKAERRARALELLDLVRLGAEDYTPPFDEPLSALDYRLRKTLEVELRELQNRTGRTFVYITHSLEEAMVMSDRIGIMRDGKLVQIGSPAEIYGQPRDRFVARFMGEVNIFEVADHRLAAFDAQVPGLERGYLIVRPEMLHPAGPGEAGIQFDATVTAIFHLGSRIQLHLDSAAGPLVSEQPASCGLTTGEVVRFGFDPAKTHSVAE